MLSIAQIESDSDIAVARELVREYTSWTFESIPGSRDAHCFAGLEEELAALPGEFGPPSGRFLLARLDGQPAGCVGFRDVGDGVCDLKRMYVRPAFRGRSLGRQLVDRLLEEAMACGYRRIVLDSHRSMVAAHAVYQSAGFRFTDPPEAFPEEVRARVVFMARGLAR